MDSIKLIGTQIVDTKKMKQSGRYRITLELTEGDTKFYGGTLAVAEINDLLADVSLDFTEIQGENNSYEESVIREPKRGETLYQRFKRICKEYSGEEYYNRLKQHLGIKHLKDLESSFSFSMVEDVLKCQIWHIDNITSPFGTTFSVVSLTHKDNAFKLWKQLFDDFNNPKNEKKERSNA